MASYVIRHRPGREPYGKGEADDRRSGMKRIRIEKQKPREPREPDMVLPLDPRDPDVVRVKRGSVWKYADRRWAL